MGGHWVATLGYQGSAATSSLAWFPITCSLPPIRASIAVNLLLTDVEQQLQRAACGRQASFCPGFLFNTEYRWAKSLDTCSNDHDCRQTFPFDQSTEYGPSDFDVRHSYKASAVWELPFFRGGGDWASRLAGGWELSTIVTASSGFPWTPVVGGDACRVVVAAGGICPLRPIGQIPARRHG